nr:hypothetical protein [uncultured Allomuricauda sp.]
MKRKWKKGKYPIGMGSLLISLNVPVKQNNGLPTKLDMITSKRINFVERL